MIRRFKSKVETSRLIIRSGRPALPLLKDSLRLQSSPYLVRHRETGLRFQMNPRCGDWFTFVECCVRKDYFAPGLPLKPGDQIIDIGGNYGAFSLMAARMVGPDGAVFTFEPSPDSCARIEQHMHLNGAGNIKLTKCAIGATSGRITLYSNPKSAYNTVHATLDGRISDQETGTEVPLVSIGEIMKKVSGRIALAKIDCEGAEYDIMEAISDPDLARIDVIVMETHKVPGKSTKTIFSKLTEHGFDIRYGNPFVVINGTAASRGLVAA